MKKNSKPKLSLEQVKEIITKDAPLIFMVGALVFTSVGLVFMNQNKQAKLDLQNPFSHSRGLLQDKREPKGAASEAEVPAPGSAATSPNQSSHQSPTPNGNGQPSSNGTGTPNPSGCCNPNVPAPAPPCDVNVQKTQEGVPPSCSVNPSKPETPPVPAPTP